MRCCIFRFASRWMSFHMVFAYVHVVFFGETVSWNTSKPWIPSTSPGSRFDLAKAEEGEWRTIFREILGNGTWDGKDWSRNFFSGQKWSLTLLSIWIYLDIDVDFDCKFTANPSFSVIDCLRQFYELDDSEKNLSKTMNHNVYSKCVWVFPDFTAEVTKEAIMFLEAAAFWRQPQCIKCRRFKSRLSPKRPIFPTMVFYRK